MGRKRKEKLLRKAERVAARTENPAPPPPETKPWWFSAAAVSVFAVVFMVIAVSAYSQKSSIVDEPVHILAGYSYLKWGDFRLNPEHPPLAKMWAVLPLLRLRPAMVPGAFASPTPSYLSGTIVARELQSYFPSVPIDRLLFYPKLQMVLLAVALGIAVFAWTQELLGFEAAAAALFLYALDPNILAHSQLIHTDLPFAAFAFLAVYFLWRSLRRVTWREVSLFCLFFAMAAATKHSFVALLPAFAVLGAAAVVSSRPLPSALGQRRAFADGRGKAFAVGGIFVAAALSAYIFLWAVYGFRFNAGAQGVAIPPAAMPTAPLLRSVMSALFELHLFPHAWLDGQVFNMTHMTRPAYLLGNVSENGFWAYFPVAFLVKTPLPTLFLVGFGIYLIVRRRIDGMVALFLLLPPAVFFFLAMTTKMNIGLRHILPIYPFLFVVAGAAAGKLWKSGRRGQAEAALLGLWLAASAVFTYPNHLAYFNELAGGPKNGYRVLIDSNLDWGQDLPGLKAFMQEKGIDAVYLSYFGNADPCFYKINFTSLVSHSPQPLPCGDGKPAPKPADFLALSVTNRFLEKDYYDWLARYTPIAQIGYSIWLYDFRGDREAHKKIATVYLKSGQLDEAQRELAFAGEPVSDKQLAQVDLGDTAAPYINLSVALFQKGKVDAAIEALKRAAALAPDDSNVRSNLGALYLSQNNYDEAVRELNAALKTNPTNAEAHNNLGTAYLRKGRPDLAYPQYSEALRLKPDYTEARANLKLAEQANAAQQPKR